MTRDELLAAARARIRETYTEQVLDRELDRLGDRLVRDGHQLRLTDARADEPAAATSPVEGDSAHGPPPALRVVAFDIETTVELDPQQPDQIRRSIYQIAVRRIGSDAAWIAARATYASHVRLPDDRLHLIRIDTTRDSVRVAPAPETVFAEVAEMLAGADVVVSYNGTGFDFDSLREALRKVGLKVPTGLRWADAMLAAVSLYELPLGRTLALAPLAVSLGWTGDPSAWHDAAHDTDLLVWLLGEMGEAVRRLPPDLAGLLSSITAGSAIWDVLRATGAGLPDAGAPTEQQIRATVRAAIGQRAAVRGGPPAHIAQFIPATLRSAADPDAIDLPSLLRAMHGERAEQRDGQRRMVETLRRWARGRRSGLLEAPTGVGKSDALLTTALEWLAASPEHRVLISTFTKQLQTQLREDIARLDRAGVSGVLAHSDVVKGKGNRLSLRALLFAIEDLTSGAIPAGRTRARAFARDARYRELVAYLLMRFIATPAVPASEWLRLSVDPQDFHPFLSEYMGSRLSYYAKHLSQALAGEMAPDAGDAISAHTSNVREALRSRRLVIVNHALLFANRDDLTDIGAQTLLLLDEAHVLEAAATDALSATVDISGVDAAVAEFEAWASDQPATLADVHAAREHVIGWAERGLFRRTVRNAFAAMPVEAGARQFGRKLVIASPLDGATSGGIGGVRFEIRSAADTLYRALRAVQAAPHGRSRIDEERRATLEFRLRDLADNLYETAHHVDDVEHDPDANWIVWAEEQLSNAEERLYETAEDFRFRLVAAPLEVARHPAFVTFTQQVFPAILYVSATLKVTNSFAFIRERLGLPMGAVEEDEVATSFNFAEQARLVAFSDFPSWQEQVDAACRSIAQQVHVFEQEVAAPGQNGVMVMTTARATAAMIGQHLEQMRHDDAATYAIHHQLVRGAGQAVLAFGGRGAEAPAEAGVLVGTKGLWQGVNVEDDRVLRMIWINKLPFASPAEPLIAARMALIARTLAATGEARFADPVVAMEEASRRYYLPLGAIELRQAVGRLIRTDRHRGVIVISDRKLDGPDRWRRRNREFFLGSLDAGLLRPDPETGEGNGAGNVMTMADGWRAIWEFFGSEPAPLVTPVQLERVLSVDALDAHTQLPEVRNIRALRFSRQEWDAVLADGTAGDVLVERCEMVARELRRDDGFILKQEQADAIRAIARGEELLALLPTSFGKSYIFQLTALVLPGVTVVISPLVALMTDQARSLNRSIGNAVRALVAPMRESNSRSGKQEVIDQLRGIERGVRLVYLSPERLATAQFQGPLRDAVRGGHLRFIALDEAHTFVTWGDDFRPSFRRAANFLRELREQGAQVIGLTATAKETVREELARRIWSPPGPRPFRLVQAPPTRPNLALYARDVTEREKVSLLESLAGELTSRTLRGHTIVYALTIKEANRLANHLRLLVGEREAWRIELFHGRLSPDAKSRILDKFKDAPHAADDAEDFEPLIIVATGAFGLGVDRDDVRVVLVASPPPDLAGLFQQVGRAGRDPATTAWGLMLATGRSLGLIEWLIGRRKGNDPALVGDIAARLLAADGASGLDVSALVDELVDAEPAVEREDRTRRHSALRTLILQLVAELDEAGVLDDLGDWPDVVRIDRGAIDGQTGETREEAEAILAACATPTAEPLDVLWRALAARYRDPGELLGALLDLHAVGALEVSQAPMDRYLTGLRRTGALLPSDLAPRLQRPLDAAVAEYQHLRTFFADRRCRHASFAAYFDSPAPVGVCLTAETRCDTCWPRYTGTQVPPEMHRLFTATPRPGADPLDDRRRRQLAAKMAGTLRAYPRGMTSRYLRAVLAGEDAIYRAGQPPQPLHHPLPSLPTFGSFQGLTKREFEAVLGALIAQGLIVQTEQQARSGYAFKLLQHASAPRRPAPDGVS